MTIADASPVAPAAGAKQASAELRNRLPLRFEACAPDEFLARASNCNIHLTATEVALTEQRAASAGRLGRGANLGSPRNAGSLYANEQLPESRRDRAAPRSRRPAADKSRLTTLRMRLLGTRRHAQLTGEAQGLTPTHYFIGNDPNRWLTNVPTCSRLRAEQVYGGVDVVYYGADGRLEYDFNVAPGASYKAVRWRFDGARRMRIDGSGDLLIDAAAGTTRQAKPVAYQIINGARQRVAARYLLCGKRDVRFLVGQYDRRLPLVIDPVLSYSTYFGGSRQDSGNAIAVDAAGNASVAGTTVSLNLPTTAGSLKREFGGGFYRSGNSGRRWQPSNSGLATPTAYTFAVDPKAAGHLYLNNNDGLYTSTDGGDNWRLLSRQNVINLVIDPDRPSTIYGLYPNVIKSTDGGATWATASNGLPSPFGGFRLFIDPQHPATLYVTGVGFFTDGGAAQEPPPQPHYFFKSTDAGANWQEVVTVPAIVQGPVALVIDPRDTTRLFLNNGYLLFRTQDGGQTWRLMSDHTGYSPLAVDPNSSGILYGHSYSDGIGKSTDDGRTWTKISNGLPSQFNLNAFVAVPTTPTTLYLGTEDGIFKSADGGNNWQEVGPAGIITFVGFDPHDPSTVYTGVYDQEDAFVAKVNASGSALLYATYLGGNSAEEAYAIALDPAGNAYVTGSTISADFPTQSAVQPGKARTASTAFLAKVNPAGAALSLATFFGGSKGLTQGQGVAVSAVGDIYVAGWTEAADLPTRGAMQATYSGRTDAFLFKIGAPRITGVALAGKRLVVSGENFDQGAVILINGEQQKTESDATNPTARLISKKAGKRLSQGQAVQLQVRNTDGTSSNAFTFTRAFE